MLALCAGIPSLFAQSGGSILGTVSGFRPEDAAIEVKTDKDVVTAVKIAPGTIVQKVTPGEKDLKNAVVIKPTDLAAGDRVLVRFAPGSEEALRIVVMPAAEIGRRNEADRQDWQTRGLAGVVAAKKGNEITLRMRSFQSEITGTINVNEKTSFRRYAPDSVSFSDAKASALAEVSVGDQLRARGEKSPDGMKVAASDVVFGTFITKAGTITAIDTEKKEITIKDLATNKPLTVKLAVDSQLKRMRDFGAMPGGIAGGMRGPGGPPAGGPPAGMTGRGGPGMGGPRDISQMIERMPPATLEDLKAGESIVVSSTKSAGNGSITAIMLLGNAEGLIRMAAAQAPGGQRANGGNTGIDRLSGMGGIGGGMSGVSGGMGGFELPGLIP